MPAIEFEFECYCDECGSLLDSKELKGEIIVEPCEKCLKSAKDNSYDEGYDEGYNEKEKGEK